MPLYERIYRNRSEVGADYVRLVTSRVRRAMCRHGVPLSTSERSVVAVPAAPASEQPALF